MCVARAAHLIRACGLRLFPPSYFERGTDGNFLSKEAA